MEKSELRKEQNGKEIRKSNFSGLREELQTAINCNRSNRDAQSTLYYLKLMRLLCHERRIFIEMAFIAFWGRKERLFLFGRQVKQMPHYAEKPMPKCI